MKSVMSFLRWKLHNSHKVSDAQHSREIAWDGSDI